jgi:hypothetical protein
MRGKTHDFKWASQHKALDAALLSATEWPSLPVSSLLTYGLFHQKHTKQRSTQNKKQANKQTTKKRKPFKMSSPAVDRSTAVIVLCASNMDCGIVAVEKCVKHFRADEVFVVEYGPEATCDESMLQDDLDDRDLHVVTYIYQATDDKTKAFWDSCAKLTSSYSQVLLVDMDFDASPLLWHIPLKDVLGQKRKVDSPRNYQGRKGSPLPHKRKMPLGRPPRSERIQKSSKNETLHRLLRSLQREIADNLKPKLVSSMATGLSAPPDFVYTGN